MNLMQICIFVFKISNNFDIERQCYNFCWSLCSSHDPWLYLFFHTHWISWALTLKLTLTLNAHLVAKTSLICIFMCFFIFIYYNWLMYFPINKNLFFFGREKSRKMPSPPPSCVLLNMSRKLALLCTMPG